MLYLFLKFLELACAAFFHFYNSDSFLVKGRKFIDPTVNYRIRNTIKFLKLQNPAQIYGVLPTSLSASSLSVNSLYGSLAGFIAFYTVLLIIEVYLMQKYIRIGPGSLGTGKYDNEQSEH